MKQLEINCHFVDLTNDELVSLDGGASWVVEAAYWIGRAFGEVAKIQVKNGDNGQWLA